MSSTIVGAFKRLHTGRFESVKLSPYKENTEKATYSMVLNDGREAIITKEDNGLFHARWVERDSPTYNPVKRID